MTFKSFNNNNRLLDRTQYFDMLEGKRISAMLPKSWKKSPNNGVITPVKMRGCSECRSKILCITCNNQVKENKDFETNLYFLKRQAPKQYVHMPPYYKELDDFNCNKLYYLFS